MEFRALKLVAYALRINLGICHFALFGLYSKLHPLEHNLGATFVLVFFRVLRYYATFKVRKFELQFYKINTCLQKTTTCIGLQAEPIFSVNT